MADKPMTDDEVVELCRQINGCLVEVQRLIVQIRNGGHPNADALADDLRALRDIYESAEAAAGPHLVQPDGWLLVNNHHLCTVDSAQGRWLHEEKADGEGLFWHCLPAKE